MFTRLLKAHLVWAFAILLLSLIIYCANCGSSKSPTDFSDRCNFNSWMNGDFAAGQLTTNLEAGIWCNQTYGQGLSKAWFNPNGYVDSLCCLVSD